MDRYFGKHGNAKSYFLRKRKQEREMLYRQYKVEKAVKKIQAFCRMYRYRQGFFKPFYAYNLENLREIKVRKAYTDPYRFSKMMGNAIYKMPFILQTLIFINDRNFLKYEYYIVMLLELICSSGNHSPIIAKILKQGGFPLIYLHKLLRFATSVLIRRPIYERFLIEFIIYAANNPDGREMEKYLKSENIRSTLKRAFLSGYLQLQHHEILLENVFLAREYMLSGVNLSLFINAVMDITIKNKELYKKLDSLLSFKNVFSIDMSFLMKSDNLYQKLKNLCSWLAHDINGPESDSWMLSIPLFLHNKVLYTRNTIILNNISEKLVPKKVIQQMDPEDLRYLLDKARKSTEYTQFLKSLPINFYFQEVIELFKKYMKKNVLLSTLFKQHSIHTEVMIRNLCTLYLLLGDIFCNKHKVQFQQLMSKDFLISLFNFFSMIDIQQVDLMRDRSWSIICLLEIFVRYLYQKLISMDDVEFVNSEFTKNELLEFVKFFNILVYQLVMQSAKLLNKSTQLQEFSIKLLNYLYNKIFRTKIFDLKVFYVPALSNELKNLKFTGDTGLEIVLKSIPFAINFESRLHKLRNLIEIDQTNFERDIYGEEEDDDRMNVEIMRGNEFSDGFAKLFRQYLRHKFRIVFISPQGIPYAGIDGGGIIKEFINIIIKNSFDPKYGLFVETSRREIIPNPNIAINKRSAEYYEFIGMIVAKAIYENILIEPKFSGPFLNLIIGNTNGLEDLKSLDLELYKSLIGLKHTKYDINEMGFTFSFPEQGKTIELRYNGANYNVTNENKLEFIMSYVDYKVNKQLMEQTKAFRNGFVKIVHRNWLQMFNHDYLNLIISGKDADFDVNDLKKNTVYNGYHVKDMTIIHFWYVLNGLNPEEKALFLLFVTSCSRPPTLGFAELKPKLCIAKSYRLNLLPSAQTCMNILRLPDYKNKEYLKKKLIIAINARAGFEYV